MQNHLLLQKFLKALQSPLAALLLILLLLLGMGQTIRHTMTQLKPMQLPALTIEQHNIQKTNINSLHSIHLLGIYTSNMKDLPLASLGVTLKGVFAKTNGQATALIAMSNGAGKIYHIGDSLAGNVVIEKILPQSVIVRHNGQLEKLAMAIQPVQLNQKLPNTPLWQ